MSEHRWQRIKGTVGGKSTFDVTGAMMAWEEGSLNEEQETQLFQRLLRNGMVWTLQGCYGRRAQALLAEGRIKA